MWMAEEGPYFPGFQVLLLYKHQDDSSWQSHLSSATHGTCTQAVPR